VLLKDLRLQSVDPIHPFHIPAALHRDGEAALVADLAPHTAAPLWAAGIVLLEAGWAQYRDCRRSVLKGRFLWSDNEGEDAKLAPIGRMGDVKRLEAFDVKDRSILVVYLH
jgi:hypothetical protein